MPDNGRIIPDSSGQRQSKDNRGGDRRSQEAPPCAGAPRWRKRVVTVGFEPDQFEAISALAERDGVSFAEAVRTLVEWGMEAR